MTVLVPGEEIGEKIGNPTPLDMATLMNESDDGGNSKPNARPAPVAKPPQINNVQNDSNATSLAQAMTSPISSLSPYHNK